MLDQVTDGLSDVQLERALVALLFQNQDAIGQIGKLDAEDFTQPELGAILLACADASARGQRISAVNLKPRLQGITTLDGADGLAILRSLTVGNIPPRADEIARRLRELAERRRASDYLRTVAQTAYDESIELRALAQDAAKHLETFGEPEVVKDEVTPNLQSLANSFIEYLQSDEPPVEITTGLADLDEATGGWHRGQFAILAGRPSMGKSTVALSSLLRTAAAGHGVLFFSFEMPANQIAARALTDFAYTDPPIAYADLKPRQSERYIPRLKAAAEKFAGLPLQIVTNVGMSADEVMERAKKAQSDFEKIGKSLDLVVIDLLTKIVPTGNYPGQPVKELDEISQAMCVMAKRLKVAVVGLHQLNRQNEDRDNQRALMSDLRGSGSLEQDADAVIFCFRPAYRLERQVTDDPSEKQANEIALRELQFDMELQIAKQRNGPTTKIDAWCDVKACAVRNKSFRR